ncbi:PIR Superfamily Protein [Plasmodium malariae]|uniref:PIR Superfamily Protein n=1 Tax=Plasmodium malariae TaxID=5858 RepID=A0A1A8XAD5_PLAMA|nr:PIR Superfamily Protein [Plasmodium malariae]
MENCFTLNYGARASGYFMFSYDPFFKKIRNTIIEKTSSLSNVNDKQNFRKECLALADYLVKNKSPPSYYSNQKKRWEGAIRDWNEKYYKGLTKHGGCFMIFEEEEKEILELIYEAEDFCDEKINKRPEKSCILKARTNPNNCYSKCSKKISEYNEWIKEKKNYFTKDKKEIYEKCRKNNKVLPFPKQTCDVSNPQTFEEIPVCMVSDSTAHKGTVEEKRKENLREGEDSTISQDISLLQSQFSSEPKSQYDKQTLSLVPTDDPRTKQTEVAQHTHHDSLKNTEHSLPSPSVIEPDGSEILLPEVPALDQTITQKDGLSSKDDISKHPGNTESSDSKLLVAITPFLKNGDSLETNKKQINMLPPKASDTGLQSSSPPEFPKISGRTNAP